MKLNASLLQRVITSALHQSLRQGAVASGTEDSGRHAAPTPVSAIPRLLALSDADAGRLLARALLHLRATLDALPTNNRTLQVSPHGSIRQVVQSLIRSLEHTGSQQALERAADGFQQRLQIVVTDIAARWQLAVPDDPLMAWWLPNASRLPRQHRSGDDGRKRRHSDRPNDSDDAKSQDSGSSDTGPAIAAAAMALDEWLEQAAYPDEYASSHGNKPARTGALVNHRA
ncbi:MAG: hypothetical protein AAGA84_07660 [Pseudomonadota bacterium]